MKIDSINIEEFIKQNDLKEVTSPVYFVGGTIPDENGLFSTEIFGRPGSEERKTRFAYIDLKQHFVHPVYYKMFTSMNKKIEDCLMARKYFIIKDGELIEDPDGYNGTSFFYENYDKLKFKDTNTNRRKTYLNLISKLKKEDIFITKWLVIPAFLRDYNPNISDANEIKAVDKVNDYYVKLIRYSMSLARSSGGFMNSLSEASIQQLIYDVYEYFVFKLNKKSGMLHKSVLGKNIDYATRSVISAPRVSGSGGYNKVQIPFGYAGVPLSQVMVLLYPFFHNYIENYIQEHERELTDFEYNGKQIHITNVREQFSEDKIKKLMHLYIKSPGSRFNPLTVKDSSGNTYPVNLYKKDLGRDFTLTDLFYIAAYDIVGQGENTKCVYITRFIIGASFN